MVALNIFTVNKNEVISIIENFASSIKFIIGGAGLKGIETEILNLNVSNSIDVVLGDGELIISDLLNKNTRLIPNRHIKNNRLFIIDSSSEFYNQNIDTASIDRTILLNNGVGLHNNLLEACIVATRGCIYNCAFCGSAITRNINVKSRRRSLNNIQQEIHQLLDETSNLSYIMGT